jgi:hypothetical protein
MTLVELPGHNQAGNKGSGVLGLGFLKLGCSGVWLLWGLGTYRAIKTPTFMARLSHAINVGAFIKPLVLNH